MIWRNLFYGLSVCLALFAASPAHADDESVTGPNGVVYRIAPTDPIRNVAPAAPVKYRNPDRSGIGNIDVNAIASRATKYHQPMNNLTYPSGGYRVIHYY